MNICVIHWTYSFSFSSFNFFWLAISTSGSSIVALLSLPPFELNMNEFKFNQNFHLLVVKSNVNLNDVSLLFTC